MPTITSQVKKNTQEINILAGVILLLAIAFGGGLTFLTIKAFSHNDVQMLTAQLKRDQDVANKIIENCVVYSTMSVSYKTDGTMQLSCVMDLAYMNKLESLTQRARKLRAGR